MRCSCRKCGTYMVQAEYGLESGCKCPECQNMCRDCMGSVQGPMSPEEITARYRFAQVDMSPISEERVEEIREEFHPDWRKLL